MARERLAHALALGVARASACSSVKAPAYTPEPIITGTKREPSSLVHNAHLDAARRCAMPWSLSVRTTSRPASTP
jgi:hypothetical protein